MIYGIGTDIVNINRISTIYESLSVSFIKRILHEKEIDIFNELKLENQKIAYVAKRYAAKEAIAKALGTGIREDLAFK